MAIKDIIVVTDLNGEQPASQVGVALAAREGAHATGLALAFEPIVPGFIAAPMPADFLQMAHDQAVSAAKKSLEKFDHYVKMAGISGETRTEEMVTGGSLDPVLRQARLTDMIVVGQDNPDDPEPMRELIIEALLFDTGVPVMLVPYISKGDFAPKKVMIAWDGSATCARAVHAAMPMLEKADDVNVVIVDKGKTFVGEPGADIATYLARHNIEVNVQVIANPQVSVSDALLNYVSEQNMDLVVMGGYGTSRFREYILGGATRDILSSMTVPVIMTH
ncbi:universal stress protein [Pseudovibrio exalbescens]|uniref:universal stress protein n=1 Tax=Pseudovibrio exalbescens TaxID=197461 RepID=UPI002365EC54|nr:universal stress protein [Pseudovibrio exalbescens]MDD7911396.1 universal stress protein [Pseudovibrio exalbescens]